MAYEKIDLTSGAGMRRLRACAQVLGFGLACLSLGILLLACAPGAGKGAGASECSGAEALEQAQGQAQSQDRPEQGQAASFSPDSASSSEHMPNVSDRISSQWDADEAGARIASNGDSAAGSVASRIDQVVAGMTLEQKVAQLFIITPEALTGVGQVVSAGATSRQAYTDYPVGGLIYFGINLEDEAQTREMLQGMQAYAGEIAGLPAFLCVDEEGGTVSRIGGTPGFAPENVGDMRAVGDAGDTAQAKELAVHMGTYLGDLGFNVDFAPVADVDNSSSEIMDLRSFGTSGEYVAPFVAAQVEGFAEAGILSCAKHFPGIGGAYRDSHEESIYTDKTVEQMLEDELVPFQAAIEAGVPFVMVGHLSTPNAASEGRPASLSADIISGLLRKRMGYQGLVITDSLSMAAVTDVCSADRAAVEALLAGADMALMPLDFSAAYQGVLDAVASGELSEERINESVRRIVAVKLSLVR